MVGPVGGEFPAQSAPLLSRGAGRSLLQEVKQFSPDSWVSEVKKPRVMIRISLSLPKTPSILSFVIASYGSLQSTMES